jgi:FtsH-binding integral membrane protein
MYSVPRQWVAEADGASVVPRSLLWMVGGLLTTLLVSLGVLATLPMWVPFYSGWGPVVLVIAEFALVWYLTARLQAGRIAPAEAKALFLLYAASLGFVLVPAIAAAPTAVLPALLVSAGMFGAAAAWGYATGADMQPLGTFLFMGLVGLLLAMVVNAFLAHGALTFWVSLAGVLLFSGLTAYDVQRIRHMGLAGDGAAILGALALYLDFVNLFLFVLTLFTGRRR